MRIGCHVARLLLATAAVGALACGETPTLGVGVPAGRPASTHLLGGTPDGLTVLKCSPVAADTAALPVGPAGGTLQVGAHTLVIPAGALDSTVTITAIVPSDTVNRVVFAPEGLQFRQPATLTMSYANCNLLGVVLPKQLVYTTDALQIIETLISVDDPPARSVTGSLKHFSNYAVAW